MQVFLSTLATLIALVGTLSMMIAIMQNNGLAVAATCIKCIPNKEVKEKRHTFLSLLPGFQSKFSFQWNGQECTGAQCRLFNLKPCTPGRNYIIKVHPNGLKTVATKEEIKARFTFAFVFLAIALGIIIVKTLI